MTKKLTTWIYNELNPNLENHNSIITMANKIVLNYLKECNYKNNMSKNTIDLKNKKNLKDALKFYINFCLKKTNEKFIKHLLTSFINQNNFQKKTFYCVIEELINQYELKIKYLDFFDFIQNELLKSEVSKIFFYN